LHANVLRFRFTAPLTAAQLQAVDREVVDRLARLPGFRGYYGISLSDTEAVVVVLWATRADAQRASEEATPVTQQLLGGQLAAPPEHQIGEVVLTRASGDA